jgi:peptidoglycan hydrolase-like protein with peptidoglycan-binding domain
MRTMMACVLTSTLVLSGCGSTPTERGVSGAGIGASAGAVLGAVTGMTVLQGAVIGATAGGLTGALTRQDQINLGQPAWKQGQAAAPTSTARSNYAYSNGSTVRDLQSALRSLGYYSGPVDGIAGPKTSSAIRSYQRQNGLIVDGRASPELLNHIRQRG